MKKITAIVRPVKIHDVMQAIQRAGNNIVATVGEVRWKLDQKRLKFELVVEDHEIEKLVDAIKQAATTTRGDDGEISISPIESLIKIE